MHKLSRIKLLFFLASFYFMGCDIQKSTPNEYRYESTISDSLYKTDKIEFKRIINDLILDKESAFYADRFEHTLDVSIDSILYSTDYLKAAFFVITKNTNQSVPLSENPNGIHYNARAFIANRDSLHLSWNVKWFGIINLNYFSSYDKISTQMKNRYFRDLNKINTSEGVSRYKYNMNDVRFWEGPVWEEKAQMLENHISE